MWVSGLAELDTHFWYLFVDINDWLRQRLESSQPFSLARIGNTEGYVLESLNNGIVDPWPRINNGWLAYGGVYPTTPEYVLTTWKSTMIGAIQAADVVGWVDISGNVARNVGFLEECGCVDKPQFSGLEGISILDPGTLLKYDRPWTTALANKRVLVMSSHYHSIIGQWPHMDEIWGQHIKSIAPFNLVKVIRTPYNPSVDDRQYQPTWHATVEHLRELMSEVDYDVALIGAGSMAPALAQHAKLCGKVGITLCGTTQLFFGLIGSRWAKQPEHTDCRKYFNGAWCYPDPIDRPQRVEVMDRLELAYW
jgi:hypothetical protein